MNRLQRSSESIIASLVLFSHEIELFVFVEDEDLLGKNEKFYLILLQRIFENTKLKIKGLGGRNEVLKCNTEYLKNPIYKALFIIDGDYDILHSSNKTLSPGLFRLNKYCIENYLIQEKAIVEILCENHSSMTIQDVSDKFNYKTWEQNICDATNELVVLYAICNKLGVKKIQTSKRNIKEYKPDEKGELSKDSVLSIQKKIKDALYESKKEKVEAIEKTIRKTIEVNQLSPMDTLSGKAVLLPLIFRRSQNLINHICGDIDVFKQHLARKCDLLGLYPMKKYVQDMKSVQ